MKKTITLITLLFLCNLVSAQIGNISTHKQQENEFGFQEKYNSKFDLQGKDIIPLLTKKSSSLSTIVFGFLPYWEYSANAHANIRYNLLSHIAAFDFEADANGNISNPSGWPWTDVINAAHTAGTKVVMVVTNFNASQIHTLLTNNSSKNNLFNNIKNTISTFQLDGVNIDFEGLDVADRGSNITNFLTELTNYIHTNLPGKEVSFDSPAVNWAGWNFNNLAQSVDQLIIMAYDYNGGWSNYTGAVAPLTHPTNGISVTKSITGDYSTAIANYPNKIVLGVPYYGKHWETSSAAAGASVTNYIGSTFYRNTAEEVTTHGGYIWDSNSQTPWYTWNQGGWNQVWADNAQSLALKYDLALNQNLGGIGIWALNYDGNKTELWDLIDTKFNTSLAVDDSFIKQQLKLYPNPTKEQLKILNPNYLNITSVEIFNSYGQKLKNEVIINDVIDISDLKSAVYFIKIKDNQGNQGVFKIIKA